MLNSQNNSISLDNIISLKTFLHESGININLFREYRRAGRVKGVVVIAGKELIDRSQLDIEYKNTFGRPGGMLFRLWVELGGRSGAVSVPDELRRRAEGLKG